LFRAVRQAGKAFEFYVSFFEIYGGRLYDLLNNKKKLQVLEDKNQKVQIFGLEEKQVGTPDEMRQMIDLANSIRTTHNTVTNETSSRSHAICNVRSLYLDYYQRTRF
jgi:kinesin family protein 2/24